MHYDLLAQLPADVYQALDMSSGMSYKARVKLQDSCKRGDMANLLDRTTAAAFSHQTLLSPPAEQLQQRIVPRLPTQYHRGQADLVNQRDP